MPLINSINLLKNAQLNKYAVPAFNVENMEMIKAVIEAAEESVSPVILQTTPGSIRYGGYSLYYAMVSALAKEAKVDVVLHLDHAESLDEIIKAIQNGYTSVMIDGSKLSYKENVLLTKSVVDICSPINISTEAELGGIGGRVGFENVDLLFTNPDTAKDFIDNTSVDSLAIAVGTVHGLYKFEPKLDFERIDKIKEKTNTPLVLHGASGVPDDQIKKAIQLGVCKVNIATELRIGFTNSLKSFFENNNSVFDIRKYGAACITVLKRIVRQKMSLLGSTGRNFSFSPKAIIFDFDGVLVDSEKVYQKALYEAFKKYEFDVDKSTLLNFRSLDRDLATKLSNEITNNTIPYSSIRETRNAIMKEIYLSNPLSLKPGVVETLEYLFKKGYPLYIVSSSNKTEIEKKMKSLGIFHFFNQIYSAKQISRGKPYPDIYNFFIKESKINKEDILVFEDSPNGVNSAIGAGLKVGFIKDLSEIDDKLSKNVDVCLESILDIKNFL